METTFNLLIFFVVTFGGMIAVIAASIFIFKRLHNRHVRVETLKEQTAQNSIQLSPTDSSTLLELVLTPSQKPLDNWKAILILIVSSIFFAGAATMSSPLNFVILLITAVLFHEFGHLIAMKSYGYKNLKMLFIPWIGAVTSGENDDQDSYKIAMISLAGPVFGIFTAIVSFMLFVETKNHIYFEYTKVATFLNVFNLLPLIPLDGGHYLNETLFARAPSLEVFFKVAGGIGVLAGSIALKDPLLVLVGVLILATTRTSYKLAVLAKKLRMLPSWAQQPLNGATIAIIREGISTSVSPAILKVLESKPRKMAAAVKNVWSLSQKQLPSARQTTWLLSIYGIILLVGSPILILVVAILSERIK